MKYRAYIVTPGGHADPLMNSAMLSVVRDGEAGGKAVLRMTDKGWLWEPVQEGVQALPTVELPGEALDAVIDAVGRLRGYRPGADAVQQEALDYERRRVDKFLDLLAQGPRIIDMSPPGPQVMSPVGTRRS